MSGPVQADDAGAAGGTGAGATGATAATNSVAPPGEVLVWQGREADVGGATVHRLLPRRQRRTIGAWCFADHFGPADAPEAAMQVGPHPHSGLSTVTWLLAGEVVHRDSLGSEQLIRPGQLNLMTAGLGVSHAEETPARYTGRMHGLQLWVAQPDATRHGPAAFEHHAELPAVEIEGLLGTVLVGSFAGAASPARADTPLVGVELLAPGAATAVVDATVPLDPSFEHGVLAVDAPVAVLGTVVPAGSMAYLPPGPAEVTLGVTPGARVLLLGGEAFPEPLLMSWNFVLRSRDEADAAAAAWNRGDERFGRVDSHLGRIPAPRPAWARPT